MAEQFKESRELIEGIAVITHACIEQFADGFQATDIPMLVTKLMTNEKVVAAGNGITGVKAEFKEMDGAKVAEAIKELTPPMTDLVIGVIQSLQKKAQG